MKQANPIQSFIEPIKTLLRIDCWCKPCPLPLYQLAVLGVSLYFLVYRFSFLSLACLVFFLWRMGCAYGLSIFKRVGPLFSIFVLVFVSHRLWIARAEKHQPSQLSQVVIYPDSLRVNGDSLSFQGRWKGQDYQLYYRLQSEAEQAYFQELTNVVEVRFSGEVELPQEQTNFNGFDYKEYLRTKGIYRTVSIDSINKIQSVKTVEPRLLLSSLRKKALVHIRRTFPSPLRHYMSGLLFGELESAFEEMEDLYSSLGIIHLFALSGMQVGFFIDKWRYLLLRLGLKRELVDQLQLPFSYLYAGLTGWSVSVVRSLVQKLVGQRGISGLDNMAVTLGICYLLNPHFLLSAGGVLSFSYALLLSVFDFEGLSPLRRTLVESLSISVGILPILLFYFYNFQPLSILLTFFLSVLFDFLFLPLLTLLFLLSPVLVLSVFNGLFVWLERWIVVMASHGGTGFVLGKPTPVMLLLLLVALAVIYDYRRNKKRVLIGSLTVLILLFFVKHPLGQEVTMVNVGQGDSILVREFLGKTLLIDVGGKVSFEAKEAWQKKEKDSNASRTLIPYLKSRGISKIDFLLLTHTDTDHIGDMEEVVQAFGVGEVLVSPGSLTNIDFVARLKAMKVHVRVLKAGDSIPMMGSHLHVLYPWEEGDGGNNDSLVLYGRLLQTNFLLTGDLEDGELELIKRYPKLPVDILKAGHHGSKGSSYPEFLDHIDAKIALVSAGKDNRYKHPHQETLKRFSQRGIHIYRTDQNGAVRFRGWRSWKIETVQ